MLNNITKLKYFKSNVPGISNIVYKATTNTPPWISLLIPASLLSFPHHYIVFSNINRCGIRSVILWFIRNIALVIQKYILIHSHVSHIYLIFFHGSTSWTLGISWTIRAMGVSSAIIFVFCPQFLKMLQSPNVEMGVLFIISLFHHNWVYGEKGDFCKAPMDGG